MFNQDINYYEVLIIKWCYSASEKVPTSLREEKQQHLEVLYMHMMKNLLVT